MGNDKTMNSNASNNTSQITKLFTDTNRCLTSLQKVNQGVEDNFVKLGASLQELYTKSNELVSYATESAKLDEDSAAGSISQVVESSVSRAVKNLNVSKQRNIEVYELLKESSLALKSLRESILLIREIDRRLWTLGTNIAVQASFSQQTSNMFGEYAQELKSFSKTIKQIVSQLRDDTENMEQTLSLVRKQVSKGIDRLSKLLDKAQADVERSAMELGDLFEYSSAEIKKVGNHFENISNGISNIVVSIQFNDITRQQIEHITQSLDKAIEEKEPGFLHKSVQLQRAQLTRVIQTITEAQTSIKDSFGNIFTEVESVAYTKDKEHAGRTLTERNSPFSKLKRSFSSMSDLLNEADDLREELLGSLEETFQASSELSVHLENVASITEDLNLQAINAIVMSRKIGSGGNSLVSLAKEVHDLSKNSNVYVEHVLSKLSRIGKTSELLKQVLEQQTVDTDFKNSFQKSIERIEEAEGEFHGSKESISSMSHMICDAISSTSNQLEFLSILKDELNTCASELAAIESESVSFVEIMSQESHKNFDVLAKQYTMKSERDVHAQVFSQSTSEETGDDEFGDFELF